MDNHQQQMMNETARQFTDALATTNKATADRTVEAQRRAEVAGRDSGESSSQGGDDLPLADYEALNVRQISERLDGLNAQEIERLRDYEAGNKDRRTLVNRLNSRLEASS